MSSLTQFSYLLKRCTSLNLMQKRFRFKNKWASYEKKKTNCEQALQYFDHYFFPVYDKQWRSIRIALLSRQKHCALVNNFADVEEVAVDLMCGGADNMLKTAAETELPAGIGGEKIKVEKFGDNEQRDKSRLMDSENDSLETKEQPNFNRQDHVICHTNIHEFLPAKRIVSDKEELHQKDLQQGFYEPDVELPVTVIHEEELQLPSHLKIYVHPRSVVDRFPPPRRDRSGKVDYYVLDAGSILPVIALGLSPGDRVLDLCAAPGGKSLTALQTMLPGELVCMDISPGRCQRLKDMFSQYLPRSYFEGSALRVMCTDARNLWEHSVEHDLLFDKVLVDVPCYTDRHVLHEEDNNIFRPSRIGERLEIQNIQKALLCSALKMCKPGGDVVYSTCTLSLPQNDGVVQATLEKLWSETDMEVAVVDTSVIPHRFSKIMNFYDQCRFGQLVIPHLTANFGPTYFCKLRRLK